MTLQHNPLHLIERDLVVTAILKLGRARALMRRHLLGVLEEAAVEQIDGDAGRAEAVAANPRQESGSLGPAYDHAPASCRVIRSAVSCLRPRPPSVRNK